jgi:uncharacterized membrane protein
MLLFEVMDAVARWLVSTDMSAIQVNALVAHFVFAALCARAEVPALVPFEYTALAWATLIGYVIWLDIPSTEVWTGAVIIIGCGLYVIHLESLRHRAQVRSGGMSSDATTQQLYEETENETS